MFSIVIPLYNKELSITNTIQSVLNQTFTAFEVVIVNDGSTDTSVDKVKAFNDTRIRIIEQENGGVSSARNTGVKEAKFEWIAFLDADDLWMEDHLSTLAKMINEYPEHKAFCNSYRLSSNNNNVDPFVKEKSEVVNDYFFEAIKYHFFWTSVVCIHNTVFQSIGFFNTKLSRGEDLDVWMRVGRRYPIVWNNKITAIYNQETENKATKKKTKIEKSIIYYLDFEAKQGNELKYMKKILLQKVKSLILERNIKDLLKLLIKYNLKLI